MRVALSTAALLALLPVPALHAQSRFADIRLIVGRHGQALFQSEGLDDVRGVLTSDAEAKRLRFEAGSRSLFEVQSDRLTALHYEESKYPSRLFRRPGLYLTIHHTGATGETGFEIFRLPKDAAPALLATLERDTGLRIDRSPTMTSFLGLPIHAGVGDIVYVTDNAGHRTKGSVMRLSSSSIDLAPSGRFDATSVRQIDVSDPIWDGAVNAAGLFFVPALLVSLYPCTEYTESCSTFLGLSAGGWGVFAAGAFAGALIDAKRLRHAYRRMERTGSPLVQWRPVLAGNRQGIQVSLRF